MISGACVELGAAVLLAAVSVFLGYRLGLRDSLRRGDTAGTLGLLAAECVVNHLRAWTEDMSADVTAHSDRIERIGQDLSNSPTCGGEMVVRAVTRVLEANAHMQCQLSSAESRLAEQARVIEDQATQIRTDPLTLLTNRKGFDEELSGQLAHFRREGQPCTLCLIDLDRFKAVNDTYGHLAGDNVLRHTGGLIRRSVRSTDMAARYGGEEFAVILPHTRSVEAWATAERIRQAADAATVRFGNEDIKATVSCGLADVRSGESISEFIQRADQALYASKQAGGNIGHWHDGRQVRPIPRGFKSHASDEIGQAETAAPRSRRREDTARDAASEETRRSAPPAPERQDEPPTELEVRTPSSPEAEPEPQTAEVQRPIAEAADPEAAREGAEPSAPPWSALERPGFSRAVAQRLDESKRTGGTFTLALVKLQGYPRVIKQHGDEAAERVLRSVTASMRATVRDMDSLGMYGFAQIAVLFPGLGTAESALLATRLHRAVADFSLRHRGTEIRLTPRIGLTSVRQDDDFPRLLRRLEAALEQVRGRTPSEACVHNGASFDRIPLEPSRAAQPAAAEVGGDGSTSEG